MPDFFMNFPKKQMQQMEQKNYRYETLQVHAGLTPDEPTCCAGTAKGDRRK